MKRLAIIIYLLLPLPAIAAAQNLDGTILKRIQDATPKPLPQSPRTPKVTSDAADEGLRGKVQKIVEEREDLSGTWSQQGRNFRSITDFDERGDYLKRVSFGSNGSPYEVNVYGFLEGSRVSLHKAIYDGSGISVGTVTSGVETKHLAFDPRYSYKYEYKFDKDRIAEMRMILSNGEKGMRYVYKHTANRMEELVYGYNGKLNQKYITVFDTNGNEIEWHSIAVINLPRPDRKHLIRIDATDSHKNWTMRTFLKLTSDNGKTKYEAAWVEYRTITYYPNLN